VELLVKLKINQLWQKDFRACGMFPLDLIKVSWGNLNNEV